MSGLFLDSMPSSELEDLRNSLSRTAAAWGKLHSCFHVSVGDARAREPTERVLANREELWLLTQADRSTMRYSARVRVSARTPYNEQ